MDVIIAPLVPERVEDFFTFFDKLAFTDHSEGGGSCYCCFFHHTGEAEEWFAQTGEQNAALARDMIEAGKMRGCLAYLDGRPVGWCHYDTKENLPGLAKFYPHTVGQSEGVGAIVCFTVAQCARGQGVAKQLLAYANEQLRKCGCVIAEAYPGRGSLCDEDHFKGPLALYCSAGFSIEKEYDDLIVVRKQL